MSDNFDGFSPEEILNINNPTISPQGSNRSSPVKKATFKPGKYAKKNVTRERMMKTFVITNQSENNVQPQQLHLAQEARIIIPQIPEEVDLEDQSTGLEITSPPEPVSNDSVPKCQETVVKTPLVEVSLDDFEKRQKVIKEQNRQRKELLKKALELRTKKTHEEARRLGQIEDELKKLDVQLSNDVAILRNQIEVASLEFMEAQKRFDKAEREYLDAKLMLYTKKERKELLTSHLCTIIEQNELRKAKKLSDLMDKLQLASVIIEKPMEIIVNNQTESLPEVESKQTPTEGQPTC